MLGGGAAPDLEDLVVQVVLEGLAVLCLLGLLLQLCVRLGTSATAPPLAGLVRLVPLLFLVGVQVGRSPRWQFHP